MHRYVAGVMVGALMACGTEMIASTGTLTSEQTSGKGETSDEDRDAWLVITAIVVVSSAIALVSEISGDEMWAYMRDHQRDVRRALASGEGPFPSDLAHSLGLPRTEVARVARIVRDGRPWLGPYVDEGPMTEAATREFWGQLLVLLEADPVTGPRVERLRARALELALGRTGS